MKLKRFNEQLDNEHKDIDPYGEEKWGKDDVPEDRFRNSSGICFNCGSHNIMYCDSELYDTQMEYEYTCQDCEQDGVEVYELNFLMNVRK